MSRLGALLLPHWEVLRRFLNKPLGAMGVTKPGHLSCEQTKSWRRKFTEAPMTRATRAAIISRPRPARGLGAKIIRNKASIFSLLPGFSNRLFNDVSRQWNRFFTLHHLTRRWRRRTTTYVFALRRPVSCGSRLSLGVRRGAREEDNNNYEPEVEPR